MNQGYDVWIDRDAYDSSGNKIGSITDIFYDDVTGRPEWVAVKAGLFKGTRLVPLARAQVIEDRDGGEERMILNYDAARVKDAPDVDDVDGHLSEFDEQRLYEFYGFNWNDRNENDFGYGTNWDRERFGTADTLPTPPTTPRVQSAPAPAPTSAATGQRMEEHTEEVPVKTTAQVEVPVDTTVRLRRYQTQEQKTRMVEVPITETTEHTEVAGVEARAGQPTTTKGAAQVGKSKPVRR